MKQLIKFIAAVATLAFATAGAIAQQSADVAARQFGDFRQGSIKGLPGVLPLNSIGMAALGDVPDSQLHTLTLELFSTYSVDATQPTSRLGRFTTTTIAPLLPPREQLAAIAKMNDDHQKPMWAQPESAPTEFKDGRFLLRPTPTRLARADLVRSVYRAVQADVRAAKEYALVLQASAQREQLANNQVGAGGELVLRWAEFAHEGPDLGSDAQVGRCVKVMVEKTSDDDASFYGPKDPKHVCVAFNNVRGVAIPMAVKVRDTSQFKPNDDLRVAVVFTLSTPMVTAGNVDGTKSAIVDAKASYMQIVEANSMQTLGPRIPLDGKAADVRYYAGRDCMMSLRSTHQVPYELGATKCGLTPEEAKAAFN